MFGKVYKAVDPTGNAEFVAVKVYGAGCGSWENKVAQCRLEHDLLKQFDHPNIIKVGLHSAAAQARQLWRARARRNGLCQVIG